jgi:hypothetical protein
LRRLLTAITPDNGRDEVTWVDPAWMVAAPRTGSTFLCYLLNNFAGLPLDLVEDPEQDRDIFGEHYQLYFSEKGLDLGGSQPRVTKIHWHWLIRHSITLPEKLIVLRRRDHIAQAISLYVGSTTKTSHCSDESAFKTWQSKPVEWDEARALMCLRRVRRWDEGLSTLTGLTVFYEDLVQHPFAVTSHCFGYMETPMRLKQRCIHDLLTIPLFRLTRPEKKDFYQRLQSLALQT